MTRTVPALLTLLLVALAGCRAADSPPRLYCAASLTDVLAELVESEGAVPFTPVVASTATLARQVESGAPSGVFIAADEAWARHLVQAGVADGAALTVLASNSLVVIVPTDAAAEATPRAVADLARVGIRRLALADPQAVPAGRYARAALVSAGVWAAVRERVVTTAHVRAAVALVASGEADAAVVYATDAAHPGVRIACAVPADSHPRIVYSLLLVGQAPTADPAARELWTWLQGPEVRAVLLRHGFRAPDAD